MHAGCRASRQGLLIITLWPEQAVQQTQTDRTTHVLSRPQMSMWLSHPEILLRLSRLTPLLGPSYDIGVANHHDC